MISSMLLGFMLLAGGTTQTQQVEPSIQNLVNDAERRTLARAVNIQAKTEALLAVSKRFLKEAGQAQKAEQSQAMLDSIKSYARILENCEWQIHSQPPMAKRQSYKKQEIELRKQLKSLDDLLAGSELDDKPAVQGAIDAANALRTHFLTTFFGRDSLKRP